MQKNQSYLSFRENLNFVRSCSDWNELNKLSENISQESFLTSDPSNVGFSISWKASTCSKCDRTVDVKVLDDGCIVQITKCGDCANIPVIKDVCSQQK